MKKNTQTLNELMEFLSCALETTCDAYLDGIFSRDEMIKKLDLFKAVWEEIQEFKSSEYYSGEE